MKVFVYRNLRRGGYSVRCEQPGHPDKGRVIGVYDRVLVREAKLVVQPAGRDRVRRTGRKNVHAGVRGVLECTGDAAEGMLPHPITRLAYDPYRFDSFVCAADGSTVRSASKVKLSLRGAFAWGVELEE